ncbi:hypothetical protein OS493_035017 [Desmophyllum pertusum]|uniref:Uncharacterized protein n=1 Tax=Desmophyllum pertusum TaxID=174260 RepID=A0A9X0CEC9_9CNID|nr:hypothetical protein OS493_035017 [Desmophyllum pertusum]
MGNDTSKKGKDKTAHPKIIPKGRNDTKCIRLLLHDESNPPTEVVEHFCDAINALKPQGSLEIKQRDVKILHLSDTKSLSESRRAEVKLWISEWLGQNGVVLICLLSKHDVQPFADDVNVQGGKIVAFSFGKTPSTWKECVSLNVDLKDVESPRDFEGPLEELVATVKAE